VLNTCRDTSDPLRAPDSKIITSIITCGDAVSPHAHVPSDAERNDRGHGVEMARSFLGDLTEDNAGSTVDLLSKGRRKEDRAKASRNTRQRRAR
jgi:hypothetical protein